MAAPDRGVFDSIVNVDVTETVSGTESCLPGFNRQRHVTPILASLRPFPISFRINFKILQITFNAPQGLALDYVLDLLSRYEPVCSLTSSGGALLVVPKSNLNSKGDWTFSISVDSTF